MIDDPDDEPDVVIDGGPSSYVTEADLAGMLPRSGRVGFVLRVLWAPCPRHGAQPFEWDEPRELYACPACPSLNDVDLTRAETTAVVHAEDLRRNPDGGDVREARGSHP